MYTGIIVSRASCDKRDFSGALIEKHIGQRPDDKAMPVIASIKIPPERTARFNFAFYQNGQPVELCKNTYSNSQNNCRYKVPPLGDPPPAWMSTLKSAR